VRDKPIDNPLRDLRAEGLSGHLAASEMAAPRAGFDCLRFCKTLKKQQKPEAGSFIRDTPKVISRHRTDSWRKKNSAY
jgi:hypothetical protein